MQLWNIIRELWTWRKVLSCMRGVLLSLFAFKSTASLLSHSMYTHLATLDVTIYLWISHDSHGSRIKVCNFYCVWFWYIDTDVQMGTPGNFGHVQCSCIPARQQHHARGCVRPQYACRRIGEDCSLWLRSLVFLSWRSAAALGSSRGANLLSRWQFSPLTGINCSHFVTVCHWEVTNINQMMLQRKRIPSWINRQTEAARDVWLGRLFYNNNAGRYQLKGDLCRQCIVSIDRYHISIRCMRVSC